MSRPLPLHDVTITEGFWENKQRTNRQTTIPIEYEQCKNTGRLDAWKLSWKEGEPNKPHVFWDSDVAKLIEAAGYTLAKAKDDTLEHNMDELIQDIKRAQQPDGYLNTYYTTVEPDKKWSNLRDCHELYCAGHLMEAAVAYFQGTGKRTLLDVLCRYADHIATVFGPGENQKKGYPGHEEIELALVKLAEITGRDSYLKLAQYFINQRGTQPYYFDEEAIRRQEPTYQLDLHPENERPYQHLQAHLPVREQKTAEGHAVRACYLYAGMAAVARETGDQSLVEACKTLWENITTRRMYVTGGIGSTRFGERFTFDYDLPNEEAYAETCAAIALCFFAFNMTRLEPDADYADTFERALYNAVISGVSNDGRQFFYDNLLASFPPYYRFSKQKPPRRQDWFGCACCPPNIARLIASLNQYIYTQTENTIYLHQFINSEATIALNKSVIQLTLSTDYPWDGNVKLLVKPEKSYADATIAIRIPGWCTQADATLNGKKLELNHQQNKGYAYLKRRWRQGDEVSILFHMPVRRVYANPQVRQDAGRVALMRGPILFCFEEADNGDCLGDLRLPPVAPLAVTQAPEELGDVPAITAPGLRRNTQPWEGKLYDSARQQYLPVSLTAIPYFLWANRKPGDMTVWLLE